MAYVYIIGAQNPESDEIESVKIGVTTGSPEKRLSSLQTGNHRKLTLIAVLNAEQPIWAYGIESTIHKDLHQFRESGEWFRMSQEVRSFIGGTFANLIRISNERNSK